MKDETIIQLLNNKKQILFKTFFLTFVFEYIDIQKLNNISKLLNELPTANHQSIG